MKLTNGATYESREFKGFATSFVNVFWQQNVRVWCKAEVAYGDTDRSDGHIAWKFNWEVNVKKYHNGAFSDI